MHYKKRNAVAREQIDRIIELRMTCMTYEAIAHETGVSREDVARLCQKIISPEVRRQISSETNRAART